MLRSSSKEIAAVSSRREVLRSREKVTLDGIVRFIKVNTINVDVCLLKTGQRMIGGEDQLLAVCLLAPVVNNSRASAAEVMSLHRCERASQQHQYETQETQQTTAQQEGYEEQRQR